MAKFAKIYPFDLSLDYKKPFSTTNALNLSPMPYGASKIVLNKSSLPVKTSNLSLQNDYSKKTPNKKPK
ncbi:hypothetical protein THIOM_004222 [Candidatus Thiomargarita nelsonii]|uniref:Uncharacterized protein n=1 Tax=Candidatus Thiomargarita nelsonii TaxID=1003181 RepID=A0A176RWH9_9GAMM|nr:hypothetical protein THIOM_004222 [Candidatus Thiomargarita nelsonii]